MNEYDLEKKKTPDNTQKRGSHSIDIFPTKNRRRGASRERNSYKRGRKKKKEKLCTFDTTPPFTLLPFLISFSRSNGATVRKICKSFTLFYKQVPYLE